MNRYVGWRATERDGDDHAGSLDEGDSARVEEGRCDRSVVGNGDGVGHLAHGLVDVDDGFARGLCIGADERADIRVDVRLGMCGSRTHVRRSRSRGDRDRETETGGDKTRAGESSGDDTPPPSAPAHTSTGKSG